MEKNDPESKARKVVDTCADCDVCRYLMDTTCFLFPELYRLYGKELETGQKITPKELRNLVDLCNFCTVCPCRNIRADIMRAKSAFTDRDGLRLCPYHRRCRTYRENMWRLSATCQLSFSKQVNRKFSKRDGGDSSRTQNPQISQKKFPDIGAKEKSSH